MASSEDSREDTKGALFAILAWTRNAGEVKAASRLRIKALPFLLAEQIAFDEIAVDTACSNEMVASFRSIASDVVGKACPF